MAKDSKASVQDPETQVVDGGVPTVEGEVSPAADQSNRGNEIAARMAMAPVRTVDNTKKKSAPKKSGEFVNEDGEVEYADPDDLDEPTVTDDIPRDVCLNCKNHGRESKLDPKGFCKRCGFKLNRLYNIQLEPSRKVL